MLDYQRQESQQTLAEGIAEHLAANKHYLETRKLTPQSEKFCRCHDASHVVVGCDLPLNDEAVVKISSIFGTTIGWDVLQGYRLAESKDVYKGLQLADIVRTALSSLYLAPITVWRCLLMRER